MPQNCYNLRSPTYTYLTKYNHTSKNEKDKIKLFR